MVVLPFALRFVCAQINLALDILHNGITYKYTYHFTHIMYRAGTGVAQQNDVAPGALTFEPMPPL